MKIREKGPMSQLVSHDDYSHSIGGMRGRQKSEDWTSEECSGNGHGLQSQFIKTRTMMAQHVSTIADAKKSHHIRLIIYFLLHQLVLVIIIVLILLPTF